jgi:arsenate reductase (glutaredoxin)
MQVLECAATTTAAVARMPKSLTIYHNPRCSKSRQTLALLQARGETPEIHLLTQSPPSPAQLRQLLKALGMQSARDLVRKGESLYKNLGLAEATTTEKALLEAMSAHPELIERPIVVLGERAVLGRPPENALTLFSPSSEA